MCFYRKVHFLLFCSELLLQLQISFNPIFKVWKCVPQTHFIVLIILNKGDLVQIVYHTWNKRRDLFQKFSRPPKIVDFFKIPKRISSVDLTPKNIQKYLHTPKNIYFSENLQKCQKSKLWTPKNGPSLRMHGNFRVPPPPPPPPPCDSVFY